MPADRTPAQCRRGRRHRRAGGPDSGGVGGQGPRGGSTADLDRGDPARPHPRTRGGSGAAEGRGSRPTCSNCSPRTPRSAGRRPHPGPPGVPPHRDRSGGSDVPQRRRRLCRDRGQAARRDRRRGATHPLPGTVASRQPARGRSRGSSPPSRSSRRPRSSPTIAGSGASPSTTTPCADSTIRRTGCSDPPGAAALRGGKPADDGRSTYAEAQLRSSLGGINTSR